FYPRGPRALNDTATMEADMDISEGATLESRIADALKQPATSDAVAALIAEVDAALATAADGAERARSRALDPSMSALDAADARREIDDRAFGRDRLQEAARRLSQRLIEVKKSEEQDRRRQDYERVRAARDELAAQLAELYPDVERRLAGLISRIAA